MYSGAPIDVDEASAPDPASQLQRSPATWRETFRPWPKAAPPTQTPAPDHKPAPRSRDRRSRNPQCSDTCPTAAPPPSNGFRTPPPKAHEKCADRIPQTRMSYCPVSDLQSLLRTAPPDRLDCTPQ